MKVAGKFCSSQIYYRQKTKQTNKQKKVLTPFLKMTSGVTNLVGAECQRQGR